MVEAASSTKETAAGAELVVGPIPYTNLKKERKIIGDKSGNGATTFPTRSTVVRRPWLQHVPIICGFPQIHSTSTWDILEVAAFLDSPRVILQYSQLEHCFIYVGI